MNRALCRITSAATALALLGASAFASHDVPAKARTATAYLVTAYEPCTTPTVMTDPPGLILPACPAIRGDPTCGFGPTGSGKIKAKVLVNPLTHEGSDVILTALMKGLEGCDGETLTVVASTNTTLDDCGGLACTIETPLIARFALGSCEVNAGVCGIGPVSINAYAGGTVLEAGKAMNLEITEVGVRRGALRTFSVGLFLPPRPGI
jgi:hypothetical protein